MNKLLLLLSGTFILSSCSYEREIDTTVTMTQMEETLEPGKIDMKFTIDTSGDQIRLLPTKVGLGYAIQYENKLFTQTFTTCTQAAIENDTWAICDDKEYSLMKNEKEVQIQEKKPNEGKIIQKLDLSQNK